MKHIFRNIFLLNLIFFSNSNINSCVSVNYDDWNQYEKVCMHNLEEYTRRYANKFIQSTGFDYYTIPSQFLPEYEEKIKDAIESLKRLINSNWDGFIYLSNVQHAVQTYLIDFKKKLTKIILATYFEQKVNQIIEKIAHKKEINLSQLSYSMISEYNDLKYKIILRLKEKMLNDGRNYVRTTEIKQIAHKRLDTFFDKVKNQNTISWTNIASSILNAIFNQPSSATNNKYTGYLNKTCAICNNKFVIGDRAAILNCSEKHFFHEGCIKQWFTNQKSCPVCHQTTGANGKALIIAQIENVGNIVPYQDTTTNFSRIQSYELDSKILELANQELSYHGIAKSNLPARVVSDFNDAIKKIKERFQTIMSLENRTYVTQNEAALVIRDELKSIIDKINYIGETCSICLENFRSGDKVGILNCNGAHFFHKDCIYAWLNTDARKSCPLCRQENLIISQIHDVK